MSKWLGIKVFITFSISKYGLYVQLIVQIHICKFFVLEKGYINLYPEEYSSQYAVC